MVLKASPLLAQCLLNRGLTDPATAAVFLEPRLKMLSDPFLLPDMDRAVARLNSGTTAEVILWRHPGNTDDPIVVTNLKYHGAPRNDGIVLMPSEVQFWRGAERPFESRGTTGYMVTIDINSRDSQ